MLCYLNRKKKKFHILSTNMEMHCSLQLLDLFHFFHKGIVQSRLAVLGFSSQRNFFQYQCILLCISIRQFGIYISYMIHDNSTSRAMDTFRYILNLWTVVELAAFDIKPNVNTASRSQIFYADPTEYEKYRWLRSLDGAYFLRRLGKQTDVT